jgi:hypothetical protein
MSIFRLILNFKKYLKPLLVGLISLTFLFPILTNAASFDFNPASNQYTAGCKNSLNIMADASGKDSNAADIELYYNPNEINIIDSVASIPGIQIKPGDAYETYFGNDVNTSTGRIRLAGASFVSNLSSRKVFASIEFSSKPDINTTSFSIKFDGAGATLDSNIADASTSDDLLTSVTNGTYTFVTGNCTADRIPPVITFQSPTKYAVNVPLNNNVTIRITDNQSGVDLNQTIIDINGDIYNMQSPEVTYIGQSLDYTIVIRPRNPFYSDKESAIKVTTADKAGNKNNDTNIFNIPIPVIQETICPDVQTGNTTNVGGNTNNNTNTNSNTTTGTNTSNSGSNTNTTTNTGSSTNTNNSSGSNSTNTSTSQGTTAPNGSSNNSLTSDILARTGGSIQDILTRTYWWGLPLLIIIFVVVVLGRNKWLKKGDKTKLR